MTVFPWEAPSPNTFRPAPALTPVPVRTGPPPGWGTPTPVRMADWGTPERPFPWSKPVPAPRRTPEERVHAYAMWRYRASAFKAESIRADLGVKIA